MEESMDSSGWARDRAWPVVRILKVGRGSFTYLGDCHEKTFDCFGIRRRSGRSIHRICGVHRANGQQCSGTTDLGELPAKPRRIEHRVGRTFGPGNEQYSSVAELGKLSGERSAKKHCIEHRIGRTFGLVEKCSSVAELGKLPTKQYRWAVRPQRGARQAA